MKQWWSAKAWPWLKKYWMWILLPIGLLVVAGKLFGGRKVEVVSSELTGAATVEREASEEAEAEKVQAERILDRDLERERETHAKELGKLIEEQKQEAEALEEDPEALNEYMKNVGRQVRDD